MRFIGALIAAAVLASPLPAKDSQVAGRVSPDKSEAITVDLPGAEHLKNVGGRDGSGLCVFTSIEHSGRWQNEVQLAGFQQKMQKEQGGGWPEKVDQMMKRYAPEAKYVQYTGSSPSFLKILLKTGRMPCVTYGYSPRYGGRIAHMVNLAHLSEKWACVLDNNFPGEDKYEWMAPEEFQRRWVMGGGGWAIGLLSPPPPPVPSGRAGVESRCWGQVSQSVRLEGSSYRWVDIPGHPEQKALYRGGRQEGTWDAQERVYRPYDGSTWGEIAEPPLEPPGGHKGHSNFGVLREKSAVLRNGGSGYTINGIQASEKSALHWVETGGGLEDDSQKIRLTVIGEAGERARVISDLESSPLLEKWKGKLMIQSYGADHWAIRGVNFPTAGPVVVVIQGPPDAFGRSVVLHCQHDYKDGAAGLAEALRQADPSYKPDKDPDLRIKPKPAPEPDPDSGPSRIFPINPLKRINPEWVLCVICGVAAFVLLRRKPS